MRELDAISGVDFPATKQQLVETGVDANLSQRTIEGLEALSREQSKDAAAVERELAQRGGDTRRNGIGGGMDDVGLQVIERAVLREALRGATRSGVWLAARTALMFASEEQCLVTRAGSIRLTFRRVFALRAS